MAKQTKGRCPRCGRLLAKSGMTRHLPTCLPSSPTRTLHLSVQKRAYWLHLAAAPDLRLEELEAFLRVFWLEGSGDLGVFEHRSRRFIDERWLPWWTFGYSTRSCVTEVLRPGESCEYVYGFGTPTVLQVTLRSHCPELTPGTRIEVLVQNEPPDCLCRKCNENPGVHRSEMGCYLLCDSCYEAHAYPNAAHAEPLPVRNSPRWLDQTGDVPDGGFVRWPLPGLDPRPGSTVPVPPGRNLAEVLADPLLDRLFSRPIPLKRKRKTALRGMRPEVVAGLMVGRLEERRLPDASPSNLQDALTDMGEMLGRRGRRLHKAQLRKVVFDRRQVFIVRSRASSILYHVVPGIRRALHDDLIDEARPDRHREVAASIARHTGWSGAGHHIIADLLEDAPLDERPAILHAIHDACSERGEGTGMLLDAAFQRQGLISLRPVMVEILVAQPDYTATQILQELYFSIEDPEEAKAYKQAYEQAWAKWHRRQSR